jgi:hypothetical protein
MQFGIYLVRKGLISPGQFVDAVERQLRSRPLIGQIALQTRACSTAQVSRILGAQAESESHESFGMIAIRLGYLDKAQLSHLLDLQNERQPRLADILVEMGLLSAKVKGDQLCEFRRAMSRDALLCKV